MIQSLHRQSPFRPQLIPPITQGLSSSDAALALGLTRQTISAARRKATYMYAPESMYPPTTPSILTTKYPIHVNRTRKLQEKHDAVRWLKDMLYVKSGSKTEVYTQHDLNYQVYDEYKKDMETVNMSK